MTKETNIAFIDWQNLHLWTTSEKWKVDFKRFRIYLKEKFQIQEAYIFLWFLDESNQKLYTEVQKAWFILQFREHNSNMKWLKKWNVDVDIVFSIMHRLLEENDFDKIVLVSWDWDYIKLVNYLIEKDKLKKILFPNKIFSSLYNPIAFTFWLNLSLSETRKKIEYTKSNKK